MIRSLYYRFDTPLPSIRDQSPAEREKLKAMKAADGKVCSCLLNLYESVFV